MWWSLAVEQCGIDCDLTRAPAYIYTRDADQREKLEEEAAAAVQLGLPAELTTELDLPFGVEAAVRFERQLHFHPGRYLAGLAAAFTAAGGSIYEHTRVVEIEEQRDRTVQLTAGTATVQANQVVVATLLPPGTLGGYFAKTRPTRSYGLACRLRGAAPQSMAISIDTPTRSTRPWLTPGPGGLIVVGNGHETGAAEVDTQQQYRELEDWTRGIVEYDGHRVGAYRDQDGTLHAVKPTCTHLGCPLHWNSAETSWDCNCHGSRFAVDGAILDGPAGEPLEQLDTP